MVGQRAFQGIQAEPLAARYDIGHKVRQPVGVGLRTHYGGLHLPLVAQHVLYLIALHALAHNHHLLILTVEEGQITVGQHIAKVTAAIDATAIGHRGEVLVLWHIALIAEGYAVAEDAYLACLAVLYGLQTVIKDFDARAEDSLANRKGAVGQRLGIIHTEVGGADGGFAGAVGIVDHHALRTQTVDVFGTDHVTAAD